MSIRRTRGRRRGTVAGFTLSRVPVHGTHETVAPGTMEQHYGVHFGTVLFLRFHFSFLFPKTFNENNNTKPQHFTWFHFKVQMPTNNQSEVGWQILFRGMGARLPRPITNTTKTATTSNKQADRFVFAFG